MAPSFLRSAKTLSTTFLSSPDNVATSPAATGLPASFITLSTSSFSIIIDFLFITIQFSKDHGGCNIHRQPPVSGLRELSQPLVYP